MAIERIIEKARNDVLRAIVCGEHHGMGNDSAMVAGLESWQSPWAIGFDDKNVDEYISVFRSLMIYIGTFVKNSQT